ncbi:glycosyltransferase [Kordiimonas aestuarii]|uniref:glycosyltransferase n=1 Tax=Kordiimonas aestuarii TaxID=1005925 RepID=UPI0021D314C7|nr:glycosyltransferase [Kordiimonas aestuarii]
MRIIHISEKHTAAAGGTTKAVHGLASALQMRGHKNSIVASGAEPMAAPEGVRLLSTKAEPSFMGRFWHYSPVFPRLLKEEIEAFKPDIIHLHGFWMGPQFVAAKIAADLGIPSILSVHGSLFYRRWQKAFRLSHLKKGLYAHWLARPRLSRVSLVHAITLQEQELLDGFFPHHVITCIPNSIELNETLVDPLPAEKHFAFIGRISPEKNLENLIAAFMQSSLASDWRLSIVGPVGDDTYHAGLCEQAKPAGDRITFTGPLYGADKDRLIRTLQAAVVPSYTEVISLVNLECAAVQVPTITTRETGLTEWQDHGGLLAGCDAASLAEALERAACWGEDERRNRGASLRQLVEKKYSSAVVTDKWEQTYQTLLSER